MCLPYEGYPTHNPFEWRPILFCVSVIAIVVGIGELLHYVRWGAW